MQKVVLPSFLILLTFILPVMAQESAEDLQDSSYNEYQDNTEMTEDSQPLDEGTPMVNQNDSEVIEAEGVKEDEGYGADDSEYYSAEGINAENVSGEDLPPTPPEEP